MEGELGRQLEPGPELTKGMVRAARSMAQLLSSAPTMLDASRAEEEGAEETVHFVFQDTGEEVTLGLRGGVMDFWASSPPDEMEATIRVETTSGTWRAIMLKDKGALRAWAEGSLKVNPGIRSLGRFMGYLDTKR